MLHEWFDGNCMIPKANRPIDCIYDDAFPQLELLGHGEVFQLDVAFSRIRRMRRCIPCRTILVRECHKLAKLDIKWTGSQISFCAYSTFKAITDIPEDVCLILSDNNRLRSVRRIQRHKGEVLRVHTWAG